MANFSLYIKNYLNLTSINKSNKSQPFPASDFKLFTLGCVLFPQVFVVVNKLKQMQGHEHVYVRKGKCVLHILYSGAHMHCISHIYVCIKTCEGECPCGLNER